MRPPGSSNIGRTPPTLAYRIATKDVEIEGELEEVPYIAELTESDITFRDVTRAVRDHAPTRTTVAEAKAIIDKRLADGEWHESMIDELLEDRFSKSTIYRAAETVVKVKSDVSGGWAWAREGTPRDSFVELGGKLGPRARPRVPCSETGNFGHTQEESPPNTPSSQLPIETNESANTSRAGAQVPIPKKDARAHTRLQHRVREIGQIADLDQAEREWQQLEREEQNA
jgi:hypothetical protein